MPPAYSVHFHGVGFCVKRTSSFGKTVIWKKIQTNFQTLPDCYSIALLSAICDFINVVVTWLDRINYWCTVVGLMLLGGGKINKPLQKWKNLTEFHYQQTGAETLMERHTIVKVLHTTNSRHSGCYTWFKIKPSIARGCLVDCSAASLTVQVFLPPRILHDSPVFV